MDAITLAASLTGFDVDVIAGVDGSGVSNKAIPAVGTPSV